MHFLTQTIFEINSNNKTSASQVMRMKRSRDSRLVDKFHRTREEMQAESQQKCPAFQNTDTTQLLHGEEEEEEEDLQVSLEGSFVGLKVYEQFCCILYSVIAFILSLYCYGGLFI